MKKIELGQTISIFANVGVILGIVLLAYELHQNNELLESQANLVLLQNRLAALEQLAIDDSLGTAVLKDRAGDELSPLEQLKLENYYFSTLSKWEWEYRQYAARLIASENLPMDDWRAVYSSYPGMVRLWSEDEIRMRFSSDFVSFINETIVKR